MSVLFFSRKFKPALLSWLVFLAVGTCTLTGYVFAREHERARIGIAFDELAALKAQRVNLRVQGYARTLLDLRGLFVADPLVTEDEFRSYLRGVEVAQRYPALLRIGYAPRVTDANRIPIASRLQRMGMAGYRGTAGDLPIFYCFPAYDALVGKSLAPDALRARALALARDSNEPQLSPQMALRFDDGHQPGFVLYVPLYGRDAAPATVEGRRRALTGYLFAAFRTEDLVESTIGPDLRQRMGLALFDAPAPSAASLAFAAGPARVWPALGYPGKNVSNYANSYASVQRADVSGRPWTFRFVAGPPFVQANQSMLPASVLGGGLLSAVLAAWLVSAAARRWRAEGLIRHLAFHDELTGMPNRAKLRIAIGAAIRYEKATSQPCALVIVELLRFRDINYTMGHQIGDEVLKKAAWRIREVAGREATVARIRNVQFGVLLPNADTGQALDCARRLVDALEQPLPARGSKYELGARAGIVSVPSHGRDIDELMRHADIALNVARGCGTASAIYDAQLDPYKPRRLALLGAFRQAVQQQQLQLYCQPKADLRTGRITSVEALVRWQHPEYGLIMPDQFISLIEPTEMIQLLTETMLAGALRQCHEWRQQDMFVPLAVNLSTRNLLNPDFPELIGSMMRSWGADPSWIELEITESSIMDDPALSLRVLNELHAMGFKLSVDDFGTGYSSLSYLMKLPIAVIKIDHSFTINMSSDPDAAAIVRAIIELAHNMGMKVIAEGASTREVWDALARLDCDEAQGYYISEPMPGAAFRGWLERSPWELAPA